MSSGRNARWLVVAFAWALMAALFLVLANTVGATPEGPPEGLGNGAIPDLTRTPVARPPSPPPVGGPYATATPKPTGSVPCAWCAPLETPGTATVTPAPTWTPLATASRPVPSPQPTGQPTSPPRGRPALILRPILQFGHSQPGGMVIYHQRLLTRSSTPVEADLSAASLGRWPLNLTPEHGRVRVDAPLPITLTVGVPLSPTFLLDVERVDASSGGSAGPSAYMITLLGRHPFSDLDPDHWADDYVQYLAARGIVSGYADGTFRPDDRVSRAQFIKMLVGAMDWEPALPETPTFQDVPTSYWAYAYIETAVAHGIIGGYADGTFHPNDRVSRAQVAKMTVVAHGWDSLPAPTHGSFTDVAASDWVYAYAEAANQAGVMSGYSDGTFRPYQSASRAQIAKIVTISLFSDPGN